MLIARDDDDIVIGMEKKQECPRILWNSFNYRFCFFTPLIIIIKVVRYEILYVFPSPLHGIRTKKKIQLEKSIVR